MNNTELKELQAIKKLLVLHLLASGIKASEIEEVLGLGERNFGKSFDAGKLMSRLRKGENGGKRKNQ
ncbi:MAG TPA: hypothetical protein VKU94_02465 [Geobacterales bacterium]|nr:hypothetical protein [Geobacterales bacterium]